MNIILKIIESVVSWTLGNITSDIDFTNYNVETAVSTLTKQEISALFSFQINLDERNNSYYKLLVSLHSSLTYCLVICTLISS